MCMSSKVISSLSPGSLYDINLRHSKKLKPDESFLRRIPFDVHLVHISSRLLDHPSDLVVTVFGRYDIFGVSP